MEPPGAGDAATERTVAAADCGCSEGPQGLPVSETVLSGAG